jgi:hypothetical protein
MSTANIERILIVTERAKFDLRRIVAMSASQRPISDPSPPPKYHIFGMASIPWGGYR